MTEYLVQHTATIKSIVDQKAKKKSKHTEESEEGLEQIPTGMEAGDKIVSAEEFQATLREKFAEVQKQGGPLAGLWDGIVDQ